MKTLEQTDRMIRRFHEKGVLLCDLAVLRGDGTFISDDSCELGCQRRGALFALGTL